MEMGRWRRGEGDGEGELEEEKAEEGNAVGASSVSE
jgi:hypothetical protein